ncbi:MAG: TIGR00730 family Rossman fold protein [Eubacterium sp.]|nr:TIGR00730 family Rossman fold protein [Eubacterium sp.]
MNIAVYCGAAKGKDPVYEEAARTVGKWIAENGHTLIYGGGNVGLMGVVANTVLELGGKVIGVIPDILFIREQRHDGITEIIDTHSMSERRNKMIELSDAFIALPGGPGTLDEISEIIMFIRIRELNEPCVLYNTKEFYEPLRAMLLLMGQEGFMEKDDMNKILFSDDIDEVAAYITKGNKE